MRCGPEFLDGHSGSPRPFRSRTTSIWHCGRGKDRTLHAPGEVSTRAKSQCRLNRPQL